MWNVRRFPRKAYQSFRIYTLAMRISIRLVRVIPKGLATSPAATSSGKGRLRLHDWLNQRSNTYCRVGVRRIHSKENLKEPVAYP